MIFYSFYTDKWKSPESLVYRINDIKGMLLDTENNPIEVDLPQWHPLQINLKMFQDQKSAERDFFSILWDNEDFRIGEYFDTEKGKKKDKTTKPQEEKVDTSHLYKVPSDFKIELNKVYNMDAITFMKTLPDKFLDYVFTSPPYNVGKRTSFGENNAIYAEDTDMYAMYDDEQDDETYRLWLFDFIDNMLRVTKKHIFMNIQMLGKNKLTVMELFWRYRFNLKDMMIWNKTIASPHINKKIMTSAFEFIFVFSNDSPEKRTFEDSHFHSKFRNVITGVNSSQNKYRHLNKATFPLYLPRKVMQQFGKPRDIWYDPCNGTGTTFHAAILEDKDYLGTELDINQCESSNKRIFVEENIGKLEMKEGEWITNGEEIIHDLSDFKKEDVKKEDKSEQQKLF